ncbi:MAG: glycosyltransferase [Planctomycetes bacterium]|nr:glycosyltransferase [Planctomycetota bacterium]
MRVLVLAAAYPSPSEPERAVYLESLNLALAPPGGSGGRAGGIELAVVAPRVSRADPAREVRRGIPVRRFAYPSGGRRLKEMARPGPWVLAAYAASALVAALDEARARGAECILAHWVLPMGPVAAAAAGALGLPFVLAAHGSDLGRYARASRLLGLAARLSLARAKAVIAVSEALRRAAVEDHGVPASRVRVVPMGIDDALFGPGGPGREEARRLLGVSPEARLLHVAGDAIPEKGNGELLEARALLARRGLECDVAVAGGGRPEPLASEPRRVRLLGRVPQRELALWCHAADLFVLPSHAEGSPVTVMEALASGLPVVATRVGGIPELVEDGATGWLVPPRDPEALAGAIERALQAGALEGARARLAASPRDFSAARRAREVRAVLEEACRGA